MPNVKLDNKVVVKNPAGTIISAAAKIMRFMGASVVTQVGPETQIDPNAGGGGGPVVIADGGTISGVYNNSVLLLGAVTVSDNTFIYGDLIQKATVAKNINIASGKKLTVAGDLIGSTAFTNIALSSLITTGLIVFGDCFCKSIGSSAVPPGLDGGSVTIYGDLHITSYIITNGNNNGTGNGGSAGNVYVYGNLCALSNVSISCIGGQAIGLVGNGGLGGNIILGGTIGYKISINTSGGSSNVVSGDAGNVSILRSCNLSTVTMNGGDNAGGSGGNAGNIILNGSAYLNGNVYLNGGNAITGNGGSGGYFESTGPIIVASNGPAITLYANGGNVTGVGVVGNAGDAGYFYILGSMQEGNIVANGGSRSLATNAGTAGNGRVLNQLFNLTNVSITSLGGANEAGSNAGKPTTNIYLHGNNVISTITMADGAAGIAPVGDTSLSIKGNVIFNKTDLTNLGGHTYRITPEGSNFACTLKIGSMVGLNTLWGSGIVNPNDFFTSNGATWYKHVGVVA